jgi:dTDP-4-dehydrorhamnose 3,5-epimerase-like enzyme
MNNGRSVFSPSGGEFSGVKAFTFPLMSDPRGGLSVINDVDLPFHPKRWFWVFGVPDGITRGAHAHREQKQFLVCVQGSITVYIDDGKSQGEVLLNQPNMGIYIPPMVWAEERNFKNSAVLLVFASDAFDPDEYIHEHDEYKKIKQAAHE